MSKSADQTRLILLIAVTVLMMITIYMILFYAPLPKEDSGFAARYAQKIFYLHLPAAIISYIAFTVVFVSSIVFLKKPDQKWDNIAHSSAEIGIIFCTIALVTGATWAKAEWQTYWRWEDIRLATFLILWFIFIAYIGLRNSIDEPEKAGRLAAVFGIVGYVGVPLSYFSMYIWQTLHPVVISPGGGGLNQQMGYALLISFITFILLFVVILMYRIKIMRIEQKVEELKELIEGVENAR